MTQKTYEEWQKVGYHVVRGEKATGRNESGKATFNDLQVEVNEYRRPRSYFYDGRLRGEQAHYDASQEGYEYEGSWEETLGGYWDNMDHLHAL